MAEKIPGAMLEEHEAETHTTMVKHIDDVFSELLREDTEGNDREGRLRKRNFR